MSTFSISRFSAGDLDDVRRLMVEYAASLHIDLAFQEIDTELATIPGKYIPPTGALLVARDTNGRAIGCVALRSLDGHDVCEMKRLYVGHQGRGLGIGQGLAQAIVEEARQLGYRAIRLDTLPNMAAAKRLYKSLGFVEIDSYYDTPIEDTVFLELSLSNRNAN